MTVLDGGGQIGHQLVALLAPQLVSIGDELRDERGVSGDQPNVEEGRCSFELFGGQGQGLLDRADGMPELQTSVPHRVPEPVGELVDRA